MPVTFTQGSAQASLSPATFSIQCKSACPDPLAAAFKRYIPLIFIGTSNGTAKAHLRNQAPPAITGIDVQVTASSPLVFGLDESYTLSVRFWDGSVDSGRDCMCAHQFSCD